MATAAKQGKKCHKDYVGDCGVENEGGTGFRFCVSHVRSLAVNFPCKPEAGALAAIPELSGPGPKGHRDGPKLSEQAGVVWVDKESHE